MLPAIMTKRYQSAYRNIQAFKTDIQSSRKIKTADQGYSENENEPQKNLFTLESSGN